MSRVPDMPFKDIVLILLLVCTILLPVSSQYADSTAYVSQNGPVRFREALQNNTITTIVLKEDYRMGVELDDIQPIPITRSGPCLLLCGVTSHSRCVCSIIPILPCVCSNFSSNVAHQSTASGSEQTYTAAAASKQQKAAAARLHTAPDNCIISASVRARYMMTSRRAINSPTAGQRHNNCLQEHNLDQQPRQQLFSRPELHAWEARTVPQLHIQIQ
jgi:hypothetical protein